MKASAKKNNQVTVNEPQYYHQGGGTESYAFAGFESNKYFTSDRFIKLDEHFRREDGQPLTGYGLEIETECTGVTDVKVYADVLKKIIFVLFPNDLFKMQEDGSLGHTNRTYRRSDGTVHLDSEPTSIGVECITQVMTEGFIRNHYKDFRTMYDVYFPAFKASCSESGRCGMHVNISNACFGDTPEKQLESIRKLYYFVNKNFKTACTLFKRDPHKVGYCDVMDADVTIERAKMKHISGGSHYDCFNFSHYHYGRIELRLVGGQANYWEFRNTMETIFFLVKRMKSIKWEKLDDFAEVFKGCNQYVYKRLQDCHRFGQISTETMQEIHSKIVTKDYELHN